MQGASTIHEFVALEIPFPYSPLLSQNQTDTHITFLLMSLFLCFSLQDTF